MSATNFVFGENKSLNRNLVAYYKFNSDLLDYSQNNNNGVANNILYTIGISGQAASFGNDRIERKILVPNTRDFDFNDGINDIPFTISFWFKATTNAILGFKNIRTTTYPNNSFSRNGFDFNYYSGIYEFAKFSDRYSNNHFLSTRFFEPIQNQVWTNLVIVNVNNRKCFFYVNGVLKNTSETVIGGQYFGMNNNLTDSFSIDGNINKVQNSNSIYGIDEFAIWKNRALTQFEVQDVYNKGFSGQSVI